MRPHPLAPPPRLGYGSPGVIRHPLRPILLPAVLSSVVACGGGPAGPCVVDGTLDLRGWDQSQVVSLDGRPVTSAADLLALLEGRSVGDQVELEILRDGVREPVTLRLESLQ